MLVSKALVSAIFCRRFGVPIFLIVVLGTAKFRWADLSKFGNTVNVAGRVLLKI